jgi:HK97 family phage prohead protease
MSEQNSRPPREDLVRAVPHEVELRDTAGGPPKMVGHFARFNEWTEIDSVFEGNFMERVAPGAFKKTIAENGKRMRVLFQHGMDPQIGDKPLGSIDVLKEDSQGPRYEVTLLDAPYVRDNILPGLRANLYGSSFRFSVQREEFNRDASASDYNPKGLPERTLKEVAVREFGPVTFPAYAGATAGVRSLTDWRLRALLQQSRMDVEDLGTLACMIKMGAEYIDEQDEPGDEANIPVMENVLSLLSGLVPVEASEDEPVMEPEDEMSSDGRSDAAPDGAPRDDHAPSTDAAETAPRVERRDPYTWQVVLGEQHEEESWIPRI